MPEHTFFKGGGWNATCDICGRVFKNTEMREAWDKSMRCAVGGISGTGCWEPRHPQDFIRPVEDIQSTPWARPWIPSFSQGLALTAPGTGLSSFTISVLDASRMPQPVYLTSHFLATLSDGQNREVVSVGSVVAGTVILQGRALNGTQQQNWPIGTLLTAITGVLVN